MIRQIIMSKSKDMPTLYFLQHRPLFLNLRFSSRLLHPLKIRNNFAVPFEKILYFCTFTIRFCNPYKCCKLMLKKYTWKKVPLVPAYFS